MSSRPKENSILFTWKETRKKVHLLCPFNYVFLYIDFFSSRCGLVESELQNQQIEFSLRLLHSARPAAKSRRIMLGLAGWDFHRNMQGKYL